MSQPFRFPKAQLNTRFRKLQQRINEELGIRREMLRFQSSALRSGVTVWRLANNDLTDRQTLLTGMSARLATAADDGAELQFYLAEQWVRSQTHFRFHSSNLKFALFSTEPDAVPLFFRLEWAGRELGLDGEYVYPGKGSAHPHWQFDGDVRGVGSGIGEADKDGIVDIELTSEEDVIDLGGSIEVSVMKAFGRGVDMVGYLPWFSKLHLPARAMWSQEVCAMPGEATPQQHEPESVIEIDNWIISALRYMRHEFQQYSA